MCEVVFECIDEGSVGVLSKGYDVVAVNFDAKASNIPDDKQQDHDDEGEDGCPC